MRWTALGAVLLLAAGWALTLWVAPWSDESVNDLFVYRTFAAPVLDGGLPYRDIAFEYPPLAAPAIALPGVAGTAEEAFRWAFALWTLAAAAAVVLLCGALARAGAPGARPAGEPASAPGARPAARAARPAGEPASAPGARPAAVAARRAMLAAALMPLLCGALLRTHFDLFPVALVLGALLLLARERPRAGFAVLGLAVMTKVFPIVVVPVAVAWLLARGRRREAWQGAAVCALVIAVIGAGAIAASPGGALDAVRYHLDRPVQIESSPALVLLGLDAVGAGEAHSASGFRSDGLTHPASGAVTSIFVTALVALIALLCATLAAGAKRRHTTGAHEGRGDFWTDEDYFVPNPWSGALERRVVHAAEGGRGEPTRDPAAGVRALAIAGLAACAGFALFGKVLSPQFVIWVLPLGALAFAWRMYALAAAVALVAVLTQIEFPAHYFDVVARELLAIGLVAARNIALAAVVALSLRELQLGRQQQLLDGSRSPVRVGLHQ